MNRSILFWVCCALFFPNGLLALDFGVSHAVLISQNQPYLEVNLEIARGSLEYLPTTADRVQGKVEITIVILNGSEIINYEKYVLLSPELPLIEQPSILDVKRLSIPAKNFASDSANLPYTLEVHGIDLNKLENKKVIRKSLEVPVKPGFYMSEIQLLRGFFADTTNSPFVKSGYYLEPLPFSFYDKRATILTFYAEIYNSNQIISDDSYILRLIMEQELSAEQYKNISLGNQRRKPTVRDMALIQMDISQLPTGNYRLTAELRNKSNELLAQRAVSFQRSNPYLKIEEKELKAEDIAGQFVEKLNPRDLEYTLRGLAPLATGNEAEEVQNILKSREVQAMQFYVFRHFAKKDPNRPEAVYREFMDLLKAADEKFHSGFRYGFETDRGRTFLKYGMPNDIVRVDNEPAAPPYEIWVYFDFPVTKQQNVKFLFYNPTLAGDDFVTLHSTARGEINNPRWEIQLYSRNATNEVDGDYHDSRQMKDNFNRNARRYFESY